MSVDALHQLPDAVGDEEQPSIMPDPEASFSIRLFPEGFSIGRPLEAGKAPPPIHEAMVMLYPYNRSSESFLRALDGGCIPGDLLEEIPCRYTNGCITCEVLEYFADSSSSSKSTVDVPTVYKITLKPSMESIAKDVSSMVDETWTYKDLMEVESKILKTAWPELHLDPEPSGCQTEKKALLRSGPKIFEQVRSIRASRLSRRLRWASAKTMVKAGSLVNSKKICFEMAPERLVGEAMRQSSIMSADSPMQFALKSKNMGSLSSLALSPKPGMPNAAEITGLSAEKQSSLLGKRDGREFGGKLDIKKLKQESPRPQLHSYRVDQEQDLKAFGLGYDNSLEAVKLENSDQQRTDESTRMRDENSGVGMAGGQSQVHDSQLLYQRLAQQDMDNQSWQVSGLVGDRDSKQEELLQRKRILMMQQKLDGRVFQQPMANDVSCMASGLAQNASSVVTTSGNQALVSSTKDQLQVSGAMALSDQIFQGQQLARRRTNSLPKNVASIAGAASPGSTINTGGIAAVNSPSTASMPPAVSAKSDGLMLPLPKRDPLDNFPLLLAVAERHNLPAKRPKNDIPPLQDIKKTTPLFHELECALNTSSDEIKDPKGQRNMADSLVGGNVNSRKQRFLQFQKAVAQGPHHVRRVLVMCERGKDAMVEAVVQFGDDQDDETLNSGPHHVLPTMANAHAADIFAKQFYALLEKEGFELVNDQVQPTIPRGTATANAACAARPLPAGASSLSNNVGPLPSPRSLMSSHMPAMAGVAGMQGMPPLQPSSPGALASTRMPPPGNVANRQISGGYLGQPGISTSKLLPLDGPGSQLGAVQHPQQHQPSLHMQRAQQMVMPTQLAQLNHNPAAQQLNQQIAANTSQLQQFLQQQRQPTPTAVLQRKLMGMGGLGMSNLGGVGIPTNGGNQGGLGNMMGVNAMNNVAGMSGINNVSASMGSMTGLNNVGQLQSMVAMGQNPALSNMISRSGNLSAAQLAAFSSKLAAQGRSGHPMGAANPNSAARDSLSGLNPSSQLHASAGMPIMGQAMNRAGRVGLTAMQRASPIGGLSSPRLATSNMSAGAPQGMYLNGPQQVSSQQQFNLQQLSPMQQQQALAAQQMQLTQSQQMSAQVQQQHQQQQQQPNPSQQLNLQQAKNSPQMLNSQASLLSPTSQQSQQQQQLSAQASMNPSSQQQSAVGSLGSLVGGPASPQLSSQNVGSVTSANNMETTITNCSATSLSSG
ncbi:hypothetical protein L7F22_030197 [Adiantum nelumboides]|nr:hypothetical protein [Adiantum nelumboides]